LTKNDNNKICFRIKFLLMINILEGDFYKISSFFNDLRSEIRADIDFQEIERLINASHIFEQNFHSISQKIDFFIDNFLIFYINDILINRIINVHEDIFLINIRHEYDKLLRNKLSIFNKLKDLLLIDDKIIKNLFEMEKEFLLNEYIDIIALFYEKCILKNYRKEYGLYSTPDFIIRAILDQIQSFGLKNNIRILDNSCGTGNFLLEMVRRLDKLTNSEKVSSKPNILMVGIDINPIALQILLISFIKILKKITNIKIRVLNEDALLTKKELMKFDVVVGNPPYFIIAKKPKRNKTQRLKRSHKTYISDDLFKEYNKYYSSKVKQINIFNLFIEQGINSLDNNGYLGFIVPDIILTGQTSQKIREFILNTCAIKHIIKINGHVFNDGGISNVIIILEKNEDENYRLNCPIKITYATINDLKYNNYQVSHTINQEVFLQLPNYNFAIDIKPENWDELKLIFEKMKNNDLLKLKDIVKISRGIEVGKSNKIILKQKEIDQDKNLDKNLVKVISIDNILPFKINYNDKKFPNKYIIYNPNNIKIFKKKDIFKTEKILIKRISNKITAALDINKEFFCLDSVQILNLLPNVDYNIYYLLAVLNSSFLNKYYQLIYGNYKKLFTRVNKNYLMNLPIPIIDQNEQKKLSILIKELISINDINRDSFKIIKNKIDQIIQNHYLSSRNKNN